MECNKCDKKLTDEDYYKVMSLKEEIERQLFGKPICEHCAKKQLIGVENR